MKSKIRKAAVSDRFAISELTKKYSGTLPRSPEEILEMIENYHVATGEDKKVIGCCGFKIWESDAEIISLIVSKSSRGQGIARLLLKSVVADIRTRKEIKRIFSLTTPELAKNIFVSIGFIPVGIQMFSEKVIGECKRCSKNRLDEEKKYLCNEIALILSK